jgi:hypothetical protein
MLHAIAAVAIGTAPGERDYRLTLAGAPDTSVAVRAQLPRGWIAAFCTAKTCAAGHTVVTIPTSGSAVIALHVYRTDATSSHHADAIVSTDAGKSVALNITIP